MVRIWVAVLCSGAAGLMYQVAWTRALMTITSTTMTAQALVLSIFMAGLGIGSALASRRVEMMERPLRAYAQVEAAALLLAALSMPLISGSEAVRSTLGSMGVSLGAALWVQLSAVAFFLLLPTTLMGASLPLVVEHVERAISAAPRGRAVGVLYGFNTLGAAVGCSLSGFWSVENAGLTRTCLLGAGLASIAVLAALSASPIARSAPGTLPQSIERRLLAVAAAAGFVGLGAEVVWTRMIALVVRNTVYAFTQVLLGTLLGIALGGWLAGALSRTIAARSDPVRGAHELTGSVLAAAAVLLALLPLLVVELADAPRVATEVARGSALYGATIIVLMLAPPAALVAATLPLLVTMTRAAAGSRSFGELYAANTAGSVAGSVLTGFVLLPALGLARAGMMLVLTCLVLAWILLSNSSRKKALQVVSLAGATSLLLFFSISIPADIYAHRLKDGSAILEIEEAIASDVMVTEHPRTGMRRLWINSSWVATAGGGTGHGHRMIGHVPSLLHPGPKKGLGIALGTGQTFSSVLSHGVERLVCVEINPAVVRLSRRWFGAVNEGVIDDPRSDVHVDDGRAFMRSTHESFDLIVLEPLQAWSAWTSNLYSHEFYQEARRILAPGGVMLQWIPFYGQGPDETRSMVRTAVEVFPHSSLWFSGFEGMLMLRVEPEKVDPEIIERRIHERHLDDLLASLGVWNGADLLSHLLLGPRGLAAWTNGAEIVTDDRPFLEFRAARDLDGPTRRAIIESLARAVEADDLSDYLTSTSTRGAERLREAAEVRSAIFAAARVSHESRSKQAEILERGLERVPQSRWLREYHRSFLVGWMRHLDATRAPSDEIEQLRLRAQKYGVEFSARRRAPKE